MDTQVLVRLFAVLAPLSLMSVGGGQAIVADMHRQVVGSLRWMSDGQFVDLFAVSRMAPGPGSLLAALVGWRVAGWSGIVVACIAFFGPSSALFFAFSRFWSARPRTRLMAAVEQGLAPISSGLVLATTFVLLSSAEGGKLAWIVAVLATAAIRFGVVGPFSLLWVGAAVFMVLG